MAVSDTSTDSTADERAGATQRAIEKRIASAFAEDMQVAEIAPDIFQVWTAGGEYVVDMRDGAGTCLCPDAAHRTNKTSRISCKHAYYIEHFHCDDGAGGDR